MFKAEVGDYYYERSKDSSKYSFCVTTEPLIDLALNGELLGLSRLFYDPPSSCFGELLCD